MRTRAALFDLDGTLVDTLPDLAHAARAMMRALGRAAPAEAHVRDAIGDGVTRLVHRMLTGERWRDAPPGELERALPIFERSYAEANGAFSAPFPDAPGTLGELRRRGWALGCITNKPAAFTRPLLARAGLAELLDAVVCGDECRRPKPDPEPVLTALERLEIPPGRAILVGDSVNDVQAGRRAGVPVVGVAFGYGAPDRLEAEGASAVVAAFPEIPVLAERLVPAAGG